MSGHFDQGEVEEKKAFFYSTTPYFDTNGDQEGWKGDVWFFRSLSLFTMFMITLWLCRIFLLEKDSMKSVFRILVKLLKTWYGLN